MPRFLITLLVFVVLAGCRAVGAGDPSSSPGAHRQTAIVEFSTTQDHCCWTEGALSYATLEGPSHIADINLHDQVDRDFDPNKPLVIGVRRVIVLPGHYVLTVWQRPCDGNCGYLDPPAGFASVEFDVAANETLPIGVVFRLTAPTRVDIAAPGPTLAQP